jgi:hypothetical protein
VTKTITATGRHLRRLRVEPPTFRFGSDSLWPRDPRWKDGISALNLQRTLEIGSYQTAWAMLHRLRAVLVRPEREQLSGSVVVDEIFIGGAHQGCAADGPRARRSSP